MPFRAVADLSDVSDAGTARTALDLTPFQRSGGAAAIHAALKANRSCGIAVALLYLALSGWMLIHYDR